MWPFSPKETRAVSSSDPYLGEFLGARWQARADIERASGHAVAHRCIQLISEQLAAVPLKVYRREADGGRVAASDHALYGVLQDSFSPFLTAFEGREWMLVSALMYGNAYARIERNGRSQISALHPLKSPSVTVERLTTGRLRYKVAKDNGGTDVFTQDEILHVRYRTNDGVLGLSPIQLASAAFGLALAQQDQAGAAAENAFRPAGALVFPEKLGGAGKDEAIKKFKERFVGQLKANEVMVLDGGAKFETFQFNSKDSEFLDSRKLSNLDICRVYGVPPSAVGITDDATYSNIGEESRALVTRVLAPWAKRLESVYNSTLLSPEARKTHYIEHDLSGLLRGDLATRYAAYKIGRESGFLSVDEIRSFENMSKVPGGEARSERSFHHVHSRRRHPMKINTISIEPIGGHDRETGARRLAKVQFFLPELQVTLRDVILTHDHDLGFVATPEKPKKGLGAVRWVNASPFAKALSEAAATAYTGMLTEEVAELKELYANFK